VIDAMVRCDGWQNRMVSMQANVQSLCLGATQSHTIHNRPTFRCFRVKRQISNCPYSNNKLWRRTRCCATTFAMST
jgi:hypothetical protein